MGKIIDLAHTVNFDDIVATKGANYKPDFRIFTAGIESDRSNPRLVHMIGSSTEKDMQGDQMSLLALNDMTKATSNMTIWLNHDYSLPDSMFGSVVGTPMITHQDGIADLNLAVDVELDNPAAARVKKYIDNGRRLGCSIGCMVTKYEVPTEEDGPDWQNQGIIVHGVYVVEYSVVGIPANQRSWVENAIRGVFTRTYDPLLAPAMKSLWPTSYKELMKSAPDNRRSVIEAMPERPKLEHRLDWQAKSKSFVLTHQGKAQILSPDQVKSLFRGEEMPISDSAVEPITDITEVIDMDTNELDEVKAVGMPGATTDAPERTETDGQSHLPDGDNDEDDQVEAANETEAQNAEEAPEISSERVKGNSEISDITKDADLTQFEIPEHVQALLASYNMLGKSLGLPEITSEMYVKNQHPALQKDSGGLGPDHMISCLTMHDMLKAMTGGACCIEPSQISAEAPQQALQQTLDASLIEKLTKSIDAHHKGILDLSETAGTLTQVKGNIDLTKKELELARKEVETLSMEITKAQETIAALKDMPLGNPVHHSRTVHESDAAVRREDFVGIVASQKAMPEEQATESLSAAFALTTQRTVKMNSGQFLKYRVWPEGVGGSVEKGVRPPLTSNQIAFMDFGHISAYRAGGSAEVPLIETQICE